MSVHQICVMYVFMAQWLQGRTDSHLECDFGLIDLSE
jgi:hypothetical protein